jgi:hypothetical protein
MNRVDQTRKLWWLVLGQVRLAQITRSKKPQSAIMQESLGTNWKFFVILSWGAKMDGY